MISKLDTSKRAPESARAEISYPAFDDDDDWGWDESDMLYPLDNLGLDHLGLNIELDDDACESGIPQDAWRVPYSGDGPGRNRL